MRRVHSAIVPHSLICATYCDLSALTSAVRRFVVPARSLRPGLQCNEGTASMSAVKLLSLRQLGMYLASAGWLRYCPYLQKKKKKSQQATGSAFPLLFVFFFGMSHSFYFSLPIKCGVFFHLLLHLSLKSI